MPSRLMSAKVVYEIVDSRVTGYGSGSGRTSSGCCATYREDHGDVAAVTRWPAISACRQRDPADDGPPQSSPGSGPVAARRAHPSMRTSL